MLKYMNFLGVLIFRDRLVFDEILSPGDQQANHFIKFSFVFHTQTSRSYFNMY